LFPIRLPGSTGGPGRAAAAGPAPSAAAEQIREGAPDRRFLAPQFLQAGARSKSCQSL
jgi:hypothetical protein